MDFLRQNLRYAARTLRRDPALTIIAGFALTLGIGLTTTIFSLVYGILLRGLPFDEPQQIMHIDRTNLSRGIKQTEVSIHDFRDWRAQQRAFGDLAAFYYGTVNLSGSEKPERYPGAFMTANTFDVLRVKPLMGRAFRESDERQGGEPVVMIGYSVWRDRYASDPAIVGKTIRANGEQVTVVGVMPNRFAFPYMQVVWLPLRMDPLAIPRGEGQKLEVVGRLNAGVSVDDANAQMNAIASRLQAEHPQTNEGIGAVVKPFIDAMAGTEGRAFLYTMLGAVFLVLLVACANVANLLLSRAAGRSREVAVRTALGAGRRRIVAQFLTEALGLAIVGGVFGTGLAFVGVRLLNDGLKSFNGLPSFIVVKVDGASLLFVLATTIVATLMAGLVPALQASRADIAEVLKDAARGSSSFRIGRISKTIVMIEIALSCGLLVGAGLTIKSVMKLRTVDYGFETRRVFTARIGLPEAKYNDAASQLHFYEQLQARLAALPGVEAASFSTGVPVTLPLDRDVLSQDGHAYASQRDYPTTGMGVTAPGYFAALRVAPHRGRDFTIADREGSLPVAIVNESFARRFFPKGDAIGQRIRQGDASTKQPWRTIVGVAPDLYTSGPDNKEPDAMYVPLAQSPQRFLTATLLTRNSDPLALTATVRKTVSEIDSDLPIYNVNSLAAAIHANTWFYRLFGGVFMIFGFVALFLASVGLYGVMAFSVKQRTHEVGIRMALGAQVRDVLQLIMRQGFTQIAVGLAFGLALAVGVWPQVAQFALFQVNPRDPFVFAAVVFTLLFTGLVACFIPALRAARLDPLVALRNE